MAASTTPRFKSREAALRLYFRAGELFAPNAKPGIFAHRRPRRSGNSLNLADDFFTLDSCFYGLKDVQLWLLREMYGPGDFGFRRRPFVELYAAARRQFPNLGLTPHKFARLKQEALKIFEAHLKRERMIL
ncbi:MAG TPA: hypothetical protein VMT64_03035 [Candidatus Binataceae bacterium]|nr:hypothetical protein [Candidatus Binataceae bacterium]